MADVTNSNKPEDTRRKLLLLAFAALPWILYVVTGLAEVELPGVYMDEANAAAFSPAIASPAAQDKHHFRLPDNIWGNQSRFPILGGAIYNSVVESYLGVPFFETFGYSTASLRMFHWSIGAASLLLFQLLSLKLFRPVIASLVASTLALDPAITFGLRHTSTGCVLLDIPILAALLMLLRIISTRECSARTATLLGALIAAPIAVYFIAIPIVAPVAILSAVLLWRQRRILPFVIGGFVAYSPILYAYVSIWIQAPAYFNNFGMPGFALNAQAAAPANPVVRLVESAAEFWMFFSTDFLVQFTGARNLPFMTTRGLIICTLFVLAAFVSLGLVAKFRFRNQMHWFAACSTWLPVALFICLGSVFSAISFRHMVAVLPFCYLAFGFLLHQAVEKDWKSASRRASTLAGIAAFLVIVNLISFAHQRIIVGALRNTGGIGRSNEYVSKINLLVPQIFPDSRIVFAGWGYHLQFLYLTRGRVPFDMRFSPPFNWVPQLMQKHGPLAICLDLNSVSELEKFAVDNAITHEVHVIHSRQGLPVYAIVRVSN